MTKVTVHYVENRGKRTAVEREIPLGLMVFFEV